MRQCGAAVRSACDTVTPLRSVSMLQTCCSSFTQHWRSAALSVQKRIQTDEHGTQTEKCMHISITHTPTHTHTGTHTQARPAGTHRAHLQVLAHTYRHRHAHALTRANRARPHLLEAALPPLAARADAYTPRCLGSSPAPRLFIALPPRGVQDPIRLPKRLVHFCFLRGRSRSLSPSPSSPFAPPSHRPRPAGALRAAAPSPALRSALHRTPPTRRLPRPRTPPAKGRTCKRWERRRTTQGS